MLAPDAAAQRSSLLVYASIQLLVYEVLAYRTLIQVLAPDAAAQRGKVIEVGDIVVKVDGQRLSGWSVSQPLSY